MGKNKIFNRSVMEILFKYWMRVAHWIGGFITATILMVLFFSIFSVAGIILRLLRKDLLHLCLCPHAGSYWMVRSSAGKDTAGFTRQF